MFIILKLLVFSGINFSTFVAINSVLIVSLLLPLEVSFHFGALDSFIFRRHFKCEYFPINYTLKC